MPKYEISEDSGASKIIEANSIGVDRGDQTTRYEIDDAAIDDEGDYQNGEPSSAHDWQPLTETDKKWLADEWGLVL